MKPIGTHNYFVYITTNLNKTTLYTGVTNDLRRRIWEHKEGVKTNNKSFTAKYNCTHLIYYERFEFAQDAIDREKQIKGWNRLKKDELIKSFNPVWRFLEDELED
ncbi:MAG: GIY-YIG nuclease family protein [Bacteroidetes bacterium]|nr:GIY-YIG nuclease family protein [Bacteroidota bacterium]